MKKLLTIIILFISLSTYSQIRIDSTTFTINHGDLTLYLDKDTASFISVHKVTYKQIRKIDGVRSDIWHKEKPKGPYNKQPYQHSGYDLGHLTPSNITSYDDSLNYHSFSFLNQAPQMAAFNRGPWAHVEGVVVEMILASKSNATIITGVLYENDKKLFLGTSRIKIPFVYYKVLFINGIEVKAWIGSNINGLVTETDLKSILDIAIKSNNKLNIVKIN